MYYVLSLRSGEESRVVIRVFYIGSRVEMKGFKRWFRGRWDLEIEELG